MNKMEFDYLAVEIPEAVSSSLEGINRITGIIESMRYFSHPGRETKVPIDANEVLENALTISRNHWKYCAEVIRRFDPDLPLIVVNAAQFNQVLLNLVVNACDAIVEAHGENPEKKGSITLETRAGRRIHRNQDK